MKILLLSILLVNSSFAQVLVKELDSLLLAKSSPTQAGMAVLFMQNGKVLYKKGFGVANMETKQPITAKTNFRLASVSKQFTAMCIMLLEKQHKLSYEDNLIKFFPDFDKKVGSSIKIKHLLTHTSGILDYEELIPDKQKEQILDADIHNLLKQHSKTYFEVGSKFQYSNSGFCLLAQIVEKASGESFVNFIEHHIFKPLGMLQTRVYEANKPIPNRAIGYARNNLGDLVFSDQSITSASKGDGCVYTSLDDYLKWYKALESNRLVNLSSEIAKVNHLIEGTANVRYGLGWFHGYNSQKQVELYHTGSTCGFSNVVNLIPSKQYLFVSFTNIADNHELEKPIQSLLKKYQINPGEIGFQKALSLTR